MKRLVLASTLLCCVSAWAQTKPAGRTDQANEPGHTDRVTRPGYPITVHVISSKLSATRSHYSRRLPSSSGVRSAQGELFDFPGIRDSISRQ